MNELLEPAWIARNPAIVKTDAARLKAVSVFCGKKDVRQVLNGVCVQPGRLCATNGHIGVRLRADASGILAEHGYVLELPESDLIIMPGGDGYDVKFPDIDRAYPDISRFEHCFVVDSSAFAARLRGLKKFNAENYKVKRFVIDIQVDGMEFSKRFNVDYLLKLAETFQRFGYKKFSLYLSKHLDVLRADSFDGMMDVVVMGVRKDNDDQRTDFKPIGSEVLFAAKTVENLEQLPVQKSQEPEEEQLPVQKIGDDYPSPGVRPRYMDSDWPRPVDGWLHVGGANKVPGYSSELSATLAIKKNKEWACMGAVIVPFSYHDGSMSWMTRWSAPSTRFMVMVRHVDYAIFHGDQGPWFGDFMNEFFSRKKD